MASLTVSSNTIAATLSILLHFPEENFFLVVLFSIFQKSLRSAEN